MAYRKIEEFTNGPRKCVVQYCNEWQEYRVRMYYKNSLYKECDYFTTDKDDAICSAKTTVGLMPAMVGC